MHVALAALLGGAGVAHALLAPAHFQESTPMGLGFVGAAASEIGLAGLVLIRRRRDSLVAVIAVATVLIGLYAYDVAIGLPFGSAQADAGDLHAEGSPSEGAQDESHGTGLRVGAGEPIDAAGAVTKLAELGSLAIAGFLLRRDPSASPVSV